MFNMLNTRIGIGKNAPLVCNFLDSLSKIVALFALSLSPLPIFLSKEGLQISFFRSLARELPSPFTGLLPGRS